jgi:hypothetical protein
MQSIWNTPIVFRVRFFSLQFPVGQLTKLRASFVTEEVPYRGLLPCFRINSRLLGLEILPFWNVKFARLTLMLQTGKSSETFPNPILAWLIAL